MKEEHLAFDTALIHAGDEKDSFGSPITPIYQTSTFRFDSADQGADRFTGAEPGYIYTRLANPTITSLENKLAVLEGGCGAVCFASGMAAITTVYAAFLKQGDHIISSSGVYGASRVAMETLFAGFGIESSYVDTTNIENIEAAIRPNTRMLYLESPANPTMAITDLRLATQLATKNGFISVVDNTFCSPYLQKPLELGADISVHSLTKFINGHGDVVAGAAIARDMDHLNAIRRTMRLLGGNMDPNQAFLISRGVKTLSLRIERAQESAQKIAEYLELHPKIKWVKYPGLANFKNRDIVVSQMLGPGTMMSFGLVGGYKAGKRLMDEVKIAILAVSLGGVETLIQHPASMTHSNVSEKAREQAGISEDMVRFSVGIEDVNDIIADLDQALAKV